MAKTKYFFNPKTLSYEKYKLSKWILLLRGIGVFSFSLILGFIFFLIFNRFVDTPTEKKMKSENVDFIAELEHLNQRVAAMNAELEKIRIKDNTVYRAIYESAPVAGNSWKQSFQNSEKYDELRKLPNAELLSELNMNLDKLNHDYKVQSASFDPLPRIKRTICPEFQQYNRYQIANWKELVQVLVIEPIRFTERSVFMLASILRHQEVLKYMPRPTEL
jgi:hypothetical protein